jgi:hypothetical protein
MSCGCVYREEYDPDSFRPRVWVERPDGEECDCGWPCNGGSGCRECIASCGCLVDSTPPPAQPPESWGAERVGRAAFEAWKEWRIQTGNPDHPLNHGSGPVDCLDCNRPSVIHHPDMVPWESLEPHKRQKYIVQAEAAARVERDKWAKLLHRLLIAASKSVRFDRHPELEDAAIAAENALESLAALDRRAGAGE